MKKIIYGILLIASFQSCNNEPANKSATQSDSTITKQDSVTPPPTAKPSVTYKALKIKGVDSNYKYVINTFTGDSLTIIKQINRIDKKYFKNVDTLLIPEPFTTNLLDYSPFPASLPIINEVDKMFFFAYPIQAYAVYEKGKLIKWGATSMGKKATQTPTGLNFTNWKGRKITSTVNSSWVLEYNFNIMNTFGVGWHQYEMPGYPASHSCLRLFMDDAKWLYDYADSWILSNGQQIAKGNPVLVFGDYPWGQRRPWFQLAENPTATDFSVEAMNTLIQPEMEKILKEQKNRKEILAQRASASKSDSSAVVQ